jgi:hypothetical protein
MTTTAQRRRLDALEAQFKGEGDRAEFDSLVAQLDAATAAAKSRANTWPADDPRRLAPLASVDAEFAAELRRIEGRLRAGRQ